MRPVLGHEELKDIRALRGQGKLDQAEKLLKQAEQTPAVLDELRKIASVKARQAKKAGDWQAVVQHLEGYNAYAKRWRKHCIALVNQAPPPHTKTDAALLLEAKKKVS